MSMPRSKCDRCGEDTRGMTTVSFFNTQEICLACDKEERAHPRFEEARKADEAACRTGNFNFEGIGLPSGLA